MKIDIHPPTPSSISSICQSISPFIHSPIHALTNLLFYQPIQPPTHINSGHLSISICPAICLSIMSSILRSIHPTTHPLIHPSIDPFTQSPMALTHQSTQSSIHLSTHPMIHNHQPILLLIHPPIGPSTHPTIHQSPTHPPTHPSSHSLIHPLTHPTIHPSIDHVDTSMTAVNNDFV